MESRLVEFYRFGKLETGILRDGDIYLVATGNAPVYPFVMTLDHEDYLDRARALSYKAKKPERDQALNVIGNVVTAMLRSDKQELPANSELLQLDLVVNAAELGALQFEVARAKDGEPLLARRDSAVTLTRRVRGSFLESRLQWPTKHRVLFAWASPAGAGADVPHEEHLKHLRSALKPWIGPNPKDLDKVLTVLDRATLDRLEQTVKAATESGQPFSHVHFLAHGYPIDNGHRQHFGVAMHDENLELVAVAPEELVRALGPLKGTGATVTLATCDSGNEGNALISERSIAHQLHVSGIPIVLASQHPLTIAGSNLLVEVFYGAILAGEDVRMALHKSRVVLRENESTTFHDWVSLVCYASLPEGYADVLLDIRLQQSLAALKTAQAWSDELSEKNVRESARYEEVEELLRSAISNLSGQLTATGSSVRRDVLEENYGLLGSGEKRLAELYFRRNQVDPSGDLSSKMVDALKRSRDWYLKAAQKNLSHHWQSVQALSLEAVLTGKIGKPGIWHAAVEAALIASETETEYWALGSLAELYLLAPLAGQRNMADDAAKVLQDMQTRLSRLQEGHGDRKFAPESTLRQLLRYVVWWTQGNRLFPGECDLCESARQLATQLERP